MMRLLLPLLLAPMLLSGCATPKYACGVPDGIGCKPLSEVQRIAQNGTLKLREAPDHLNNDTGEKPRSDLEKLISGKAKSEPQQPVIETRSTQGVVATVSPGMPILTPPRTLRVWVARWSDDEGTLHDETYLYLRLDNGQWRLE